MKKVFLPSILILSFLSIRAHAACDPNGQAQVVKAGGLSLDEGAKMFRVCRDGDWRSPTLVELIIFYSRVPEAADRWTPIMSEGHMITHQAHLDALAQGGSLYDEIQLSNVDSTKAVRANQTPVLEEMLAEWNRVMDKKPVEKLNYFSMEVFNKLGKENQAAIENLVREGRQCIDEQTKGPRGFEFAFEDAPNDLERMIPIDMTDLGNGKYRIRFHWKAFPGDLSSIQERTISFEGGQKIHFMGNDGRAYHIAKKDYPSLPTQHLFTPRTKTTSLCAAEDEIEALGKVPGGINSETAN